MTQIVSSRKPKTNRWLQERRNDGYVRQARQHGYRSRAVYKLEEIDSKERLVKRGMHILELGAAPGGWSQYLSERVGPEGRITAVDLIAMPPVKNVRFVQGDFTDAAVRQTLLEPLGEVDLVLSDMAPNITGIADADRARFMELLQSALKVARLLLKNGGSMLVKVFEGPEIKGFRKACKLDFREVAVRKPSASRSRSREYYILARKFQRDKHGNCL